MKNSIYFLIILMISCKSLKSDFKPNVIESRINSQAVVTKILIESANSIYKTGFVSKNTPVYIHSLMIYFKHNSNYFSLRVDSIYATKISDTIIRFQKVKITNDSIKLSDLTLPFYDDFSKDIPYYLEAKSAYHAFPFSTDDLNLKCLTANYRFNSNFFKDTTAKFNKCVE